MNSNMVSTYIHRYTDSQVARQRREREIGSHGGLHFYLSSSHPDMSIINNLS